MENQKKASGKKWIVVLCIVLALALIGGGAFLAYKFIFNNPEKKYEKAMSQAADFMDEEEYKSAIDSYKEALEYEDEDEDALEGISVAYKKLGDEYLAKEDYEKAYSNYKKAYKDVENKEAMKAALNLCYEQAVKANEEYDDEACEEWAVKYDELASKLGESDFLTKFYYELFDPEANQPAVNLPVEEEPEWEEPEWEEPEVVEPEVEEPEVIVPEVTGPTNDPDVDHINVWSYTDEVPRMIDEYLARHPEFPYEIYTTIIATTDGIYQPALDAALMVGGADAPDIYCVESAFALKYTQGDASAYAATYEELGLDVVNKIREADIASYSVEIGTRPSDGQVVALGYQGNGGAFIYNRSIAKDTWGTDDPSYIKDVIGGGSGSWDYFWAAADTLRGKGYAIISGDGDIWHSIENSAAQGWIVDGKLNIDPKRESFLDIAKMLEENDWHNSTQDWDNGWYTDIKSLGEKPVFGFFGPAWLINYVMAGNSGDTYGDWAVCEAPVGFYWGGTWILANKDSKVKKAVGEIIEWITLDCSKDGLQYAWANGMIDWDYDPYTPTVKDVVASGTVMRMSDGSLDFLGGQNMFDVFIPANAFANGRNITHCDETINSLWRDVVRQYASGAISREQAIRDFKYSVSDKVNVEVDFD